MSSVYCVLLSSQDSVMDAYFAHCKVHSKKATVHKKVHIIATVTCTCTALHVHHVSHDNNSTYSTYVCTVCTYHTSYCTCSLNGGSCCAVHARVLLGWRFPYRPALCNDVPCCILACRPVYGCQLLSSSKHLCLTQPTHRYVRVYCGCMYVCTYLL